MDVQREDLSLRFRPGFESGFDVWNLERAAQRVDVARQAATVWTKNGRHPKAGLVADFLGGDEAVEGGEVLDVVDQLGVWQERLVLVDPEDGVTEGALYRRFFGIVKQTANLIVSSPVCKGLFSSQFLAVAPSSWVSSLWRS